MTGIRICRQVERPTTLSDVQRAFLKPLFGQDEISDILNVQP